jgi:hypothetical protein
MTRAKGGDRRWTPDELIAAEVRAEMARQKVTQTKMAREAFGSYPQFLQARCAGVVPFSAWELMKVADYLRVDVVQFLDAAKHTPPDEPPRTLNFHGSSLYDDENVRGLGKPLLRVVS